MNLKMYIPTIKNIIFVIIISLILQLCMKSTCLAENHYVREGATGANDGSNWENAWTKFPVAFENSIRMIRMLPMEPTLILLLKPDLKLEMNHCL